MSLAVALIMAANQPNVPTDLRIKALGLAQIVITYAQSNPQIEPVQTAPVQPVFGTILSPEPSCSLSIATTTAYNGQPGGRGVANVTWESKNTEKGNVEGIEVMGNSGIIENRNLDQNGHFEAYAYFYDSAGNIQTDCRAEI
jgi:hypothetical protein